jgi:hypothetical protein
MSRVAVLVTAGVFLVALGLPSPARAQNLLTNPGFDTSLTGWTPGVGVVFDAAHDANGSASSGSATVTASDPGGTYVLVSQCHSGLVANQNYGWGGKGLLTSAPANPEIFFVIVFTTDASCTTPIFSAGTASIVTTGSWQAVAANLTAPAGTVAAQLNAVFRTTGPGGSFTANVDDLVLQPQVLVPTMNLPWFGLLSLAMCLIAMWTLRGLRRGTLAT